MQRARPLLAVVSVALLCLALARPASAGVLVVDAAGGGDFTTLSAAVAAAVNGDTILLREGVYVEAAPVVIDGKTLTVTAFNPAPGWQYLVEIQAGLVVQNLQAGQRVILQNLRVLGSPGTPSTDPRSALVLLSNNSHVRVENCWLAGGEGTANLHPAGAPAVSVTDSVSNAFIGCVLRGGEGRYSSTQAGGGSSGDGGAGLAFDGGLVLVSACSMRGGDGGGGDIDTPSPQGGTGGDGIEHQAGTLFMVGGISSGGDGGLSVYGGDGGDGIDLGSEGFAWLMGAAAYSHGSGSYGDFSYGDDGLHLVDPFGLLTDWSDTVHGLVEHGFDVTSPIREGQPGALYFKGHYIDSVMLFVSPLPFLFPLPGYQNVLGFSPSTMVGPLALPVPGDHAMPFVAPSLPASLEVLPVFMQPVYVGFDGTFLGTSRMLLILDSSF